MPRTRGDAVLEGAADALRGVPGADHHGDGQAEVLWHGSRSDHVDGLGHLSNRDRREAQVSAARGRESINIRAQTNPQSSDIGSDV